MKKKRQIKEEHLRHDEVYTLRKSKGNGTLRRRVWENAQGEVTRYSLAYINHHIHVGDNGRVLGYDNAHDYHHKHHMGKVESVAYKSYEEIEMRFQLEFEVIHEKNKQKR